MPPDVFINSSAIGIVAFIIWWFVKRADKSQEREEKLIAELRADKVVLEVKVQALLDELNSQRGLKHNALNQVTGLKFQIELLARACKRCTCENAIYVKDLLEKLRELSDKP